MASIIERCGRYQAIVRRKGHRPVCKTFPDRRSARYWVQKIEAEMALGLFKPAPKLTVAELLDAYQRILPPRETRRCRLLAEHFGSLWVDSLGSVELARFRDLRLAQGRAVQTVKHDIGLLNRAIKWGNTELGLSVALPPSVRLPELDNRRTRYLTLPELNVILRALKTVNASPVTRAAIILAYYSGLRRSELTKFELNGNGLYLRKTKNGDPRQLQLRPRCLVCARLILADPPNITNLSRAFAKAVARTGVEHAVLHDLRHSAITNFFRQGLSIPAVAAISGHRTWAMLSRYTHLTKLG